MHGVSLYGTYGGILFLTVFLFQNVANIQSVNIFIGEFDIHIMDHNNMDHTRISGIRSIAVTLSQTKYYKRLK